MDYQIPTMAKNSKKGTQTRKPEQDQAMVAIQISGTPEESWFFNRFDLEIDGAHLFIRLAHARDDSVETVFSGACPIRELSDGALEQYVGRFGTIPTKTYETGIGGISRRSQAFNHLACATKGDSAELLFATFSLKLAIDAQRLANRETGVNTINGKTIGIYVSPLKVHQKLLFELVDLLKKHE